MVSLGPCHPWATGDGGWASGEKGVGRQWGGPHHLVMERKRGRSPEEQETFHLSVSSVCPPVHCSGH